MSEFHPYTPEEMQAYVNGREAASYAIALLVQSLHQEEKARLEYAATHDDLTGLLNRVGFDEAFNEYVERCGPGQFGAIYIDLKDFKRINDEQGHDTGDELLIEFGAELQESVRKENGGMGDRAVRYINPDTEEAENIDILRIGDEFVILVDLSHDRQVNEGEETQELGAMDSEPQIEVFEKTPQQRLDGAMSRIATAMTHMLRRKKKYDGVRVSIGGAIYEDGMHSRELVSVAESRMYDHKKNQTNIHGSYRDTS